ncbi:MAG: flagellar hook-length control protein FliK [Rhodobacteraceae bacterium]|nr:flagellar hook-length control protein FliK [Paracoccaceae bacterium]
MPTAAGNPVPGTAQPADITSAGHKAMPGAMALTAGQGGEATPGLAQMNGPARADGTHPAPGARSGGRPDHDPERDLPGTARFPARLTAAQQGDRPTIPRHALAQAAMAEDTGTGQLRPGRPASRPPDGVPHGQDPVRQAAPAVRTLSAALPGAPVQAAGGFHAARFGATVADMTARAIADTLADDPEHRPPGSAAAPADPVRADSLRPDLARHAAGQVAVAIRAAGAMASASGPPGSFGIDLSPAELGRVRISMSVSDTGLLVAVQADRAETQDLLRRHIDHLRDMLADAGHASVRFDFGGGGRAWQGPAHPGPGMAPGSGVAAMPDAAQAPLHRNAAVTEGGLDMRL